MTEEQLRAIEGRIARATPAPWYVIYSEDEDDEGERIIAGVGFQPSWDTNTEPVVTLPGVDCEPRDDDTEEGDMEFIAHSRQDVPDLTAEVRRLQEREASLSAALRAARALEAFYIDRAWAMQEDEASLWMAFSAAARAALKEGRTDATR